MQTPIKQLIYEFQCTCPTTPISVSQLETIVKTFMGIGVKFSKIWGGGCVENETKFHWQSWRLDLHGDKANLTFKAEIDSTNEKPCTWFIEPGVGQELSNFWNGVNLNILLGNE